MSCTSRPSLRVDRGVDGVSEDRVAAEEVCPGCGVSVVAARADDGMVVLCETLPRLRTDGVTLVAVEVSASGAARSVSEVLLLEPHRCAPTALLVAVPGYDPAVLAVGCPATHCAAVSGLACRSPRGALLGRPHGVRVARALQA